MAQPILTVGHSVHELGAFVHLLAAHAVRAVADVRSSPGSRRSPQFGREALGASLAAAGVGYRWVPGLGGRRRARAGSPHVAWHAGGFRAYADHMETAAFEEALAELLEWTGTRRTALMCAERLWWQCHRRLLADRLLTRGHEVEHILDAERREPHRLTSFARLDGDRLVYDVAARAEPASGDPPA
jgi:uncharacterized protein (DUF488 family)